MNIADAARRAGLTPKAIRFYEAQGLLRPQRAANGYRAFNEADVHTLQFLKRARDLGFSVEECRSLLSLYHDQERPIDEVKSMAQARIAEIEQRLTDLASIRDTLNHLAESCAQNERPDSPVLADLASEGKGGAQGERRRARG